MVGKPFQKGKSGNPNGRPKLNHEVRELAKAEGPAAIERLKHWRDQADPRASVAACNALLDRGFGKPAQAITGEDGGPIVHTFSWLTEPQK